MVEITDINEIKKIELGILREIDRYCGEHNLKYCLTFGTLIGAIRHNGFIPWDDDIDVFMPREDYEFFIRNYESDSFKCHSLLQKEYCYSFAKLCDVNTLKVEPLAYNKKLKLGIDVDIFPVDPYFDEAFPDRITAKWERKKALWGFTVSRYSNKHTIKSFIANALRFLSRPLIRIVAKSIDKLVQSSKGTEIKGYLTAFCVSEKLRKYDKSWLWNIERHQFEDEQFFIPTEYDSLLKSIYGDYMKLPPKEKQVTHHRNNCFYIE
ncbi:MAG TPA: LicD family protein [Bacilli bacterium]|nr:LicD family protein [Bacilli bacterium]